MSQGMFPVSPAKHTHTHTHTKGAFYVNIGGVSAAYCTESHTFLHQVVVGDEKWCLHFEPTGKSLYMQWGHLTLSKSKKLNQQTSASKGMMLCDVE